MQMSETSSLCGSRQRLMRAERIISMLDRRRTKQGCSHWGSNVERMLIERELREIEDDIHADPGALADHNAPVPIHRKREHGPCGKKGLPAAGH